MSTKKILSHFMLICFIALLFNIGVWYFKGPEPALQFFGGYIIELSLSMDNLFLFLMIFTNFGIGPLYQRRVLTYGIFGAIILRLIFVVLGVAVVTRFKWVLYLFGILLFLSGLKILLDKEQNIPSFENSRLLKILNFIMPITNKLHGEKFFVVINKTLHATPLFAILFLIEGSDVVFAMDSIPAIFAITTDPFIVYTSNILAIMGLRNLYFLLEKLQSKFKYVKYGVGAVLLFTGMKLGISFKYHISVVFSISVIIIILLLSVLASVILDIPAQSKSYKHKNSI